MTYFTECETPIIGTLTLASDGDGLMGCWFENDRHFGYGVVGPAKRGGKRVNSAQGTLVRVVHT